MTPHKILKTFPGSQTGNDHDIFHEGTVRNLSKSLAAIVVNEGWAEPTEETVEEKAIEAAPNNKAFEAAPSNKAKKFTKFKKA